MSAEVYTEAIWEAELIARILAERGVRATVDQVNGEGRVRAEITAREMRSALAQSQALIEDGSI